MKNYLLDTNIISELVRLKPSTKVTNWLLQQSETSLFISSITIAEIARGAARLDHGKKREKLTQWIQHEIPHKFTSRVLDFDTKCGLLWGEWQGEADRKRHPFATMDAQIAAIAARFELTLVTRNVKDMIRLPVDLINPWELHLQPLN